ncbi:MAG TPA: hypothetical protein VHB98_16600 [Chloroflexota bacterium]|nr:hypothetical protein [Chloroflexota bacterium]
MMGMLIGGALLFFSVGALMLFMLFHLIFSLPLWLLVGGVVLYLWYRKNSWRHRYLGQGRARRRFLDSSSRW